MTNPKKNYCEPVFMCNEPINKYCALWSKGDHDDCVYMDHQYCLSSIAIVNAMTFLIKEMTK
jgi:hypothetical protein